VARLDTVQAPLSGEDRLVAFQKVVYFLKSKPVALLVAL
jgi:hypothetical protein